MNVEWQPIETLPDFPDTPIIVWLPKAGVAVSAYRSNPRLVEHGGDPEGTYEPYDWFEMTDFSGGPYGMTLIEEPSHWCVLPPPGQDRPNSDAFGRSDAAGPDDAV